MSGNTVLKVRKKTQRGKYLNDRGKSSETRFDVMYKLLESWVRVVKPTAKDHVHDNVGHTRRNQSFHVKRTTLLLSHFADHLFHFHQDPRLHDTLTESKPLQDRQTQLMMATKLGIIVSQRKSLEQQQQQQEIWADAHETGDSISLISYAGCLGLSSVISAKIHSKCASLTKIAKNLLKTTYFEGSRSFKVIDVGTPVKLVTSACYDTQQVCVYLQPFSC